MNPSSTIKIGSVEAPLGQATPNWVQQQFGDRKNSGENVCVRVTIRIPGVDLALATPACVSGPGGSRPLTENEQRIVDLWLHHKLNTNNFNVGQLVAFVQQLQRQFR